MPSVAVLLYWKLWLLVALTAAFGLWVVLSVEHRRVRCALAVAIGWGAAGFVTL